MNWGGGLNLTVFLAQAENLYRQILQADPSHSQALDAWGILALQSGNLQAAATLIQKALAINPNYP